MFIELISPQKMSKKSVIDLKKSSSKSPRLKSPDSPSENVVKIPNIVP